MSTTAFSAVAAARSTIRLPSVRRAYTTTRRQQQQIKDAYILSGSRTPVGVFNGAFTTLTAPHLGATAIISALSKSRVPATDISEVYMGMVLQGNVGQAPARQASIFAGLPASVEATTVNKVCASGLKAVSLAAQSIQLGQAEAQIAGGMENMTRVPYYLPRSCLQLAFGNQTLKDGLVADGLWDVYNDTHMGNCAENTAKKYGITRKEQDQFTILSYQRAQRAYSKGLFVDEIAQVKVGGRLEDTVIYQDQQYTKLKADKLADLKPVFDRTGSGTITAANSSSFSDGASALVLGSHVIAKQYGKDSRVLARIVSYADAAMNPIDFPIAPSKVVPIVLERAGLKQEDIAIWEFNEAFAAVVLANAKILGFGTVDKINPRGGAIALGHALGNSGSRILITLLHQLKDGEYGCAAICNGGGAATGMVVQKLGYADL